MAEPEAEPGAPQNPSDDGEPEGAPTTYFCYQCNKEVAVEGSQSAMTCAECHGGFLEAIATVNPEFHRGARRRGRRSGVQRDAANTVSLSDALEQMYPHQMLQMVQILLGAARNNRHHHRGGENDQRVDQGGERQEEPGNSNNNNSEDGESDGETGGLRLELESFDLNDEEDEWEEAEEEELSNGGGGEQAVAARDEARIPGDGGEGEDSIRRVRNDFNLYMRELIQNLMDHNLEVRVELPDFYLGNPGDYLDSAGFEQLLQQLAESDNSRRGAPPAAKSAVEKLDLVRISQRDIESGIAVCAICKEQLGLDEPAKQLPCFHLYHQDCILPWLNSRNSCPVCRYELPTDDPDYEEQKRSRKECGTGNQGDGTTGGVENSNPAPNTFGVSSSSSSSSASQEGCGSSRSAGDEGSGSGSGSQRRGIFWLILTVGPVLSVMGLVMASRLVGGQVMDRLPLNVFQAGASAAGGQRHWWSFE